MDKKIEGFLKNYTDEVFQNAVKLREVVLSVLPDIREELDLPAKMVSYSYGRKYSELICVLIPSKKGLKLGFYKGTDLPDPQKILEGTGKISRYVVIHSQTQIGSPVIKELLLHALTAYRQRMEEQK